MLGKLKQIFRLVKAIYHRFNQKSCMLYSAGLAFTTLFSIVPLMTVSFVIFKAFPGFVGIEQEIQDFVLNNFVAARADVIRQYLAEFSAQALKISAPGTIVLFITALLMVFNMEAAFNHIFDVSKSRNGLQAFLIYWAVITLLPVLIGSGIVVSSYLTSLPLIYGTAEYFGLNKTFLTIMPIITSFVGFTIAYVAIPNCKVPLKYAMVGGAVAMIFFELAKYGFALYILHIATYEALYGALAVVPIFLFWVYISWVIVLVGAVVCSEFRIRANKP